MTNWLLIFRKIHTQTYPVSHSTPSGKSSGAIFESLYSISEPITTLECPFMKTCVIVLRFGACRASARDVVAVLDLLLSNPAFCMKPYYRHLPVSHKIAKRAQIGGVKQSAESRQACGRTRTLLKPSQDLASQSPPRGNFWSGAITTLKPKGNKPTLIAAILPRPFRGRLSAGLPDRKAVSGRGQNYGRVRGA